MQMLLDTSSRMCIRRSLSTSNSINYFVGEASPHQFCLCWSGNILGKRLPLAIQISVHTTSHLIILVLWTGRRCRGLSHGQMIPAVEDKWAIKQQYRSNNRRLVTPKQLREQLLIIREKAAVVVLLVDLLDASGSFLSKLRDLTGRNPIVLIGTKARVLIRAIWKIPSMTFMQLRCHANGLNT